MAKGEGGKGSSNIWFYVIIIIVGALLGSALGEAIGAFWKEGAIHDFFVRGINPGLETVKLDLNVLAITFGFTIKLNVSSVIGIILSSILFRRL